MNGGGANGANQMDRWLKRLWLVNGVLILIAFGMMFVEQAASQFSHYKPTPEGPIVGGKLEKAKADTLALQDITSSIPSRIGNTKYCYITLSAKDLTKPARIPKSSDEPSKAQYFSAQIQRDAIDALPTDEAINLIFLSDDGSDVRLLLNEKGAIIGTDIPSSDDTIQSFNLYYIVFRDTDGNGRLTPADRSIPYVSDLDGRNLRPLTPDSVETKGIMKSFREYEIFVVGRIRPADPTVPEEDWAEVTFKYDIRTRKLSSVLPDDRLLNEARRILQTK
jgi:hypothetical protein